MSALKRRLTPPILISIAVAVLAVIAAFGITLTATEQGATVAFVGAAAIVLLVHLTAESIAALVAAGVAVAVAYGIPVTAAQEESILILTGAVASIVLGKAGAKVVKARRAAAAIRANAHPLLKTGLRPTDPAKPILDIDKVLTGITPPATEDRYSGVTFGLDGNDTYGDCGPTSVDNHRRSTSKVATGAQRTAPLADVYALYRTQNPRFVPNPQNPVEDNGVEMGAMLDALMKVGLGGDKPVAFGRLTDMSDAAIERAVAVFGGVLFAVNLETAQQGQSEGATPEWRYVKSSEWGGHAIYCGKYKVTPSGVDAPVISWAKEIGTDDSFRAKQLEEVWVIIWPWHLEHPAFLAGVDQAALAAEFKALTGKELVLPVTPPPTPEGNADATLWATVRVWALGRHTGTTKPIAAALKAWAASKGLS